MAFTDVKEIFDNMGSAFDPGAAAGLDAVFQYEITGEGGGNWMGLDYQHLERNPIPEPGALGMMFSGMIWAVPLMLHERGRGRKGLPNNS